MLTELQNKLNAATTKQELYEIAGYLNNRPEHVKIDKVTSLGFMNFDYARQQVQTMLDKSLKQKRG